MALWYYCQKPPEIKPAGAGTSGHTLPKTPERPRIGVVHLSQNFVPPGTKFCQAEIGLTAPGEGPSLEAGRGERKWSQRFMGL